MSLGQSKDVHTDDNVGVKPETSSILRLARANLGSTVWPPILRLAEQS